MGRYRSRSFILEETVDREFEQNRVEHEKLKREFGKVFDANPPENVGTEFDLTCIECGRVCLSRAGLSSHHGSHIDYELINNMLYGFSTYSEYGN